MNVRLTSVVVAIGLATDAPLLEGAVNDLPEISRRIGEDVFDPVLAETANGLVILLKGSEEKEALESQAYRLFLDSSRFQRHFGPKSWAGVGVTVGRLFEETKAKLASLGDAKAAISSIERYEAVLFNSQKSPHR